MQTISASVLSTNDLLSFSKDIAQLNLGYLGISVAILGIFIYFNFKSLKDALDKQEKSIENLKKEAGKLLQDSEEQSEESLKKFQISQKEDLTSTLERQKENIDLEIKNKVKETESSLLKVIDDVSENKDIKLKEIILSESANRLASLEKNLTATINSLKIELNKITTETNTSMSGLNLGIKNIKRDIKELKIYKYSKEGQMGAIIGSISLLKEDIDEKRWSILRSLESLSKEINDIILEPQYIADIEEQLARIENEPKYKIIIAEIRKKYTEENSKKPS